MLENRKNTKAACATPLEYESPRKGHSGKPGTDPSPGPVYQDIQDLSTKAKKVTESSTSQNIPSDHNFDDKEKEVAARPKDDSVVVRKRMIPEVIIMYQSQRNFSMPLRTRP